MDELMTIGEFATVTWLSPKALRLYDHNGLLSPTRSIRSTAIGSTAAPRSRTPASS